MSFKTIKIELLDKDDKVIDVQIDKILGLGPHKVSGTKEYSKVVNLMNQVLVACKKAGVVSTRMTEEEPKRERKAHNKLTKLQIKALRKDSKKLTVKELSDRYDISLPTVKKHLS